MTFGESEPMADLDLPVGDGAAGLDGAAGAAAHGDAGAVLPAWSRSIRRGMREELFAANQPRRGGAELDLSVRRSRRDARGVSRLAAASGRGDDPLFHAIVDLATGKAVGVATFMRIDRANGVIEVGNINYSPLLQRKPAATEAMFLMMARVFDELGYRRYEWKCDA